MKDFLKRAGIYIIAGAVGFGAVNLIKNVYYSDRPEKAAKKVNKEFGNEIELAKEKASPDKLASEILKEKFSKLAEKKLSEETSLKKKLSSAGDYFSGAYVLNVRGRPAYCASLGVSMDNFVSSYKQQNKKIFEIVKEIKIQEATEHKLSKPVDNDMLYKMLKPTVDKMVLLDMEDTAKILNVSKKEACHLLEQNHKTMAEELDFRKQAPKIAQLLLESAH
jgi:hypothetical protein